MTTAALLLSACAQHDDAYGTYDAQRAVTSSEPSPQFEVPYTLTVTLAAGDASTSTGHNPRMFAEHHTEGGAVHVTFEDGETWHSAEGDGAVNLSYALEIVDDQITGTIAAHIIFDTLTTANDFDYALSITGQKR